MSIKYRRLECGRLERGEYVEGDADGEPYNVRVEAWITRGGGNRPNRGWIGGVDMSVALLNIATRYKVRSTVTARTQRELREMVDSALSMAIADARCWAWVVCHNSVGVNSALVSALIKAEARMHKKPKGAV